MIGMSTRASVLLFVIQLSIAASVRDVRSRGHFEPVSNPPADVTLVHKCILPCLVKYVNDDPEGNSPALSAHWTANLAIIKRDSVYHDLTNDTFWRKNGLAISRTISNCYSMGDGMHDCTLEIHNCYNASFAGDYRCNVTNVFDNANVIVESFIKDPNDDAPFILKCHFPSVNDISATVYHDGNTSKVNVTWTHTKRPREKTYCDGSRQWMIRVARFSSPDDTWDMDNRITADPFSAYKSVFRDTHFTFDVEYDKYYVFQLKNKRSCGTSSTCFVERNYSSYIYFFGPQESPSFIDNDDNPIVVTRHKNADIPCQARGFPAPDQKLIRTGREISPSQEILTLDSGVFTLHGVSDSDVGLYYCSSSNTIVNPPHGKRKRTANKAVRIMLEEPVNVTMEVSCTYYYGDMCRNYIYRDTKTFHNMSAPDQQSTVISQFGEINGYTASHRGNLQKPSYKAAHITDDLITKCFKLVEALTCNTVYPYCDAHSTLTKSIPRPICKHSCDIFNEGGACHFFFDPNLLTESSRQISAFKTILLSNCDSRVNPAGSSPECIYISFDHPTIDQGEDRIKQSTCRKGKGRGYRGTNIRTESDIPCQSWLIQSPNTHSINPDHFRLELYNAGFSCRNPGGLGERPWCYTSDLRSGKRWEYCVVPECEVCDVYDGQFCSSLPGYNGTAVYIDREDIGIMRVSDIDQTMLGLFHVLDGNNLSPGCQLALRQMICHTSLPFCKSQDSPSPRKTCSDHCALLNELRFCPANIIETLQSHFSRGGVGELYKPDCSVKTEGNDDCMPSPERLGYAVMEQDEYDECFNATDFGQSYTGTVSTTLSGLSCQPWPTSNELTNDTFNIDIFPELIGAENYCRNPGQLQNVPWCMTNVETGSFGLCAVESCSITSVVSKGVPTQQGTPEWVGPIVIVFVGVPILITVAVVAIVVIRKTVLKNRGRSFGTSPPQLERCTPGQDNLLKNMKFQENNQYNMVTVNRPLSPKVVDAITSFPQISQDKIEYVKQLGQGFFGVVFKGKAEQIVEGEKETYVAVKSLKEDGCNDGIEAFVNEAKLMFSFDHPNIVRILGVSMTKTPYYLIFEYMDKGDLTKYLRQNASSLQRHYMNPMDRPRSRTESTLSDDPASLSMEQLTDICKQIANGMEHLSTLNYVHRDLACRNCLVKSIEGDSTSSRVIVKIGDFGLSHNLYSKDYYRVRGQAVLPIRWMSPEAIIYGKFSTAGDVWSFGVVMWEIFTFGMQPYYGTSNEEVMEKVRHGKVLDKPTDCSNKIYSIMTDCWQKDDQNRPSFSDIQCYLNECRASTSSDDDAQSVYSDYSSDAFLDENSDIENEVSITGQVD